MTGFELQISGVGINRATNCTTTTAQSYISLLASKNCANPDLFLFTFVFSIPIKYTW